MSQLIIIKPQAAKVARVVTNRTLVVLKQAAARVALVLARGPQGPPGPGPLVEVTTVPGAFYQIGALHWLTVFDLDTPAALPARLPPLASANPWFVYRVLDGGGTADQHPITVQDADGNPLLNAAGQAVGVSIAGGYIDFARGATKWRIME